MSGYHHRVLLVTLSDQREQPLGLCGALFVVPCISKNQQPPRVKPAQQARQRQVTFGGEQFLDELISGSKQHRVALLNEDVAECARRMALTHPGRAERQQIGGMLEELPARQFAQLAPQRRLKEAKFERVEGLAGWQLGSPAQPADFTLLACFGLHLQHFQHDAQRLLVAGLLQPGCHLSGRGGQIKAHQQLVGAFGDCAGIHDVTSSLSSASYSRRSGRVIVTTGSSGRLGSIRLCSCSAPNCSLPSSSGPSTCSTVAAPCSAARERIRTYSALARSPRRLRNAS